METMVVTTLIAILSAMAIPQWGAVAMQMRTGAAAGELLNDVQYARVMSQRTGVPYYINVEAGSGVSYTVRRPQAPPNINPGSDPAVRTVNLDTRMPGVEFTQNGTTNDCFGGAAGTATPAGPLVFNTRGLPTNGATSYFIGSEDGRNTYVVSVTGAGRARLCRRVAGDWR